MFTQNLANFTVESALKVLEAFSCTDGKTVESASEKQMVRQSLLLVASLSDNFNLGICANTASEGILAMQSYSKALGYAVTIDQADITLLVEPIYIKFNSLRQSYYFDAYIGKYRGVLVSCLSQNELINGTYGYLPLDLFM